MKVPPISLTEKLALNNPFCDLYFLQESSIFVNIENHISKKLMSIFLYNLSKEELMSCRVHMNVDEIIDH